MERLTKLWESQHIGKKTIDLRLGCFDYQNFRYRSYSSIFPNLVLLGSQKCGTSSLAQYLSTHPDIHVSMPLKEPGFYIFEDWAKRHFESKGKNYESRKELLRKGMLSGYSGQKYLMDATTRYTLGTSPSRLDIPHRLKSCVDKCIYIVRNPFSRMISSYNSFYKGKVDEGFDERFAIDSSILETSLYFKQLNQYVKVLGSDRILLLIFEEFISDIPGSLLNVYNFLDLENKLPHGGFPVINATQDKTEYLYSAKVFKMLSDSITSDVHNLEAYLGRPINWDLSSSRWVRTN